MNHSLTFKFDAEKFVNALAFFANAGLKDLTKMKAAKLLYFADKHHLLRFGTPVIGDQYYCLKYGPLPSAADNYMDEAELAARGGETSFDELFDRHLEVDTRPAYPVYRPKGGPDLDVFSPSEIESLEATVKEYGRFTASQLVGLTHSEAPFRESNKNRRPHGRSEMPYELFFMDEPEDAQRVLRLAKLEQHDRDLAAALAD